MSLLSKLKYVGVGIDDLVEIYCLFIRSLLDYCSVAFHSSLTQKDIRQLENIQSTALRILLQNNYVSSSAAREMTGLSLLSDRRQARCDTFSKRCLSHPKHRNMFPLNEQYVQHTLRSREKFKVNFSHTLNHQNSPLEFCKRRLNHITGKGNGSENIFTSGRSVNNCEL